MEKSEPGKSATGSQPGGPSDRMSRIALVLAWIVLGGVLLLEALDRLRIHLGYEPFDSQWGLIGIFSLFGLFLVVFLALFQFVFCAVGLVIAQRDQNPLAGRRLRVALGITLLGSAVFVFV